MKTKFANPSEQYQASLWIEKVLRPLADPTVYEALCNSESFDFTVEKFVVLQKTLEPFAASGTPGHDRGHHLRDLLGVAAIVGNDPTVAKAYPSDVLAGFLAGAYHDIACAVVNRYQDGQSWLAHAEIGAWIFFHLTEGLLPESIRLLAAYAIAAHTHALKQVVTTIGNPRQPWEDKIFFNLGRPVRVAVWLTRFADRLDTNGVTLLARHIVAQLDSYVYKGVDLSGSASYMADDIMLKLLLKPEAILEGTTPSTLLHIKRFAGSNDQSKIGPYNQHDARFPAMDRLITAKSKQAVKLAEVIGKDEKSLLDSLQSKTITVTDSGFFWEFLKKVSSTEDIEVVHTSFTAVWDSLSTDEQNKWVAGVKFAQKEYGNWVGLLKFKVKNATNPMIRALIPQIMEIVSTL